MVELRCEIQLYAGIYQLKDKTNIYRVWNNWSSSMFKSICRAVKTRIQKNQAERAVLMQVLVVGWCKPSIYRQLIPLLHLEKL